MPSLITARDTILCPNYKLGKYVDKGGRVQMKVEVTIKRNKMTFIH